jgi:orotidine-5'-phosphate decarboxylase
MLTSFNDIPARDRVIVALDCSADQAMRLADQLAGRAKWLKIGMTLYYACGPSIIHAMKKLGFNVFLDLKLHDIPHQIRGAAYSAANEGADMITMHTLGGEKMLAAGQEGVNTVAQETGRDNTVTLGITVLTSMDDESLNQVGIERPAADQVKLLANVAKGAGISGVVASPQEASMLRELLGPDAYIVTPGVRPKGSDKGDQSRVATPAEAFAAGASHIVVGRPITQAENPAQAFDAIAKELDELA